MIGCGVVVGLVVGLIACIFVSWLFESIVWGLIAGVAVFFMIGGVFLQAQGDVNRATQHERDNAILDELRKMNNKDE